MRPIKRRDLNYNNLEDAVEDAKRLFAHGYHATGNWNLAQTLEHCSDWLTFPLDGYPPAKFPLNAFLTLARWTVGKSILAKIVRDRAFEPGKPTMPQTIKTFDRQHDQLALDSFNTIVERFQNYRGPVHPSPLFGELTYEQQSDIQLIHVQHHLSFLVQKS